jgi:hypothetical protein
MAKPGLDKASRQAAAKAGAALPNGKFPIRNDRELKAAIKLRHHSTEKYAVVRAHILRRAAALGIPIKASRVASATPFEDFARSKREQSKRRASSKSIAGRDPSLRWPHLYDILRAKGHDKEAAARISNAHLKKRKKGRLEGLPWKKADNKKELRKLLRASALVASCYGQATGVRGTSPAPKAQTNSTIVFACYSKECAPPPAGVGGSCGKGGCQAMVHRKVSRGVLGKGKESYSTQAGFCSAKDAGKGLCSRHEAAAEKREADLLAKRNHQIAKHSDDMVMHMANKAPLNEIAVAEARRRGLIEDHPVIGSEGARGDSKPVSYEEFQRLARQGQFILDGLQSRSSAIKGLDDNWEAIKASTHAEALKEWGGATIDAHTGRPVAQGANRWALTIKDKGVDTVSIPQGASREEFDAAMETARKRFRSVLEREGSHLGVFHDDDLKRIDIDPVLVVDTLDDVHTIGAATRAIGGAYNFADGNGYWPPHVAEGG